jgi:hypothetical protein
MKELQVLAATSTPILQRFARFFTDILHESCRAIIVNTAVGALQPSPSKTQTLSSALSPTLFS